MIRALWTASSGMMAQQMNIDVTSNNLANVNTVGFKKSRADFQDVLYQTLQAAGVPSSADTEFPTGIQIGLGTRPAAVQKLFMQGDFQQTDAELDIAIEGDGFFQITQPNGEVEYTRAGAFKLDGEGRIVSSDGYPMEPEISVPEDTTELTIGSDGTINVFTAGSNVPTEIGSIELANFSNPAGLKALGRNLYAETSSSGDAITGTPGEEGMGTVVQGFLELSNVEVVDEMVSLIVGQRAYEVNAKAINTADEMLQTANNLKR